MTQSDDMYHNRCGRSHNPNKPCHYETDKRIAEIVGAVAGDGAKASWAVGELVKMRQEAVREGGPMTQSENEKVKMTCPEQPEGGLRHEYIFCHCDMTAKDRQREEAVREAVKLLEGRYCPACHVCERCDSEIKTFLEAIRKAGEGL